MVGDDKDAVALLENLDRGGEADAARADNCGEEGGDGRRRVRCGSALLFLFVWAYQ